MSNGLCGKRSYPNMDKARVERGLEALRRGGAIVTGSNPWDIDTKRFGVKLRGTWDSSAERLDVIVTAKRRIASCRRIWRTIDDLINNVQSEASTEALGDELSLLPSSYGEWAESEDTDTEEAS